ncbi:MAG TPA: PilZ domain-containing protein [Sphingomicrobium sp.]
MDIQPVETTLYSLSDAPPSASSDRRDGQRHMTLYRVGSILVEDRRELCLIKNISAGGMMIRLYCSIAEGTPVTIELKSGQPIGGKVGWTRDQNAGIEFDQPIDVIDILSTSMDGPRPRMPRIETDCFATLRDGANVIRVRLCDISQGGAKVACETVLSQGADIVIGLPGLEPQRGIACWSEGGFTGITFNRLIPLSELVAWLQHQRQEQRSPS